MLKDMHIGVSPLTQKIVVYQGRNGVARSKSGDLTGEAVFSVAHLILMRGEPVSIVLDGGEFELRLHAKPGSIDLAATTNTGADHD
jgi:hypothetical protein